MTEYEHRVIAIVVNRPGEPLFSECATRVELSDEAAGEFVLVSQDEGRLRICKEEWPALREAIETMIAGCRKND